MADNTLKPRPGAQLAPGAPVTVDVEEDSTWPGVRPPRGSRAWLIECDPEFGACTVLLEDDSIAYLPEEFILERFVPAAAAAAAAQS